jgi:hypothetical protein
LGLVFVVGESGQEAYVQVGEGQAVGEVGIVLTAEPIHPDGSVAPKPDLLDAERAIDIQPCRYPYLCPVALPGYRKCSIVGGWGPDKRAEMGSVTS